MVIRRKKKKPRLNFPWRWLIIPALAVFTFLLTLLLAERPSLTEQFYSNGLYRPIAFMLSKVSNLLPFSLDDLFYGFLGTAILIIPFLTIVKKITVKQWLLSWLNITSLVYILFYWFWGFNYFRQDFNHRLEITKSRADQEQFMSAFGTLIETANVHHQAKEKEYTLQYIDTLIEQAYAEHSGFLKLNYPLGSRRAKPITMGRFFAKAGISGYYGPFFNEIHINPHLHALEIPVVLAHEKAHQLGITSEAEASFYAWFVCSYSSSDYLKYSASLYLLRYFLNQGYPLDGFESRVALISQPVRDDLREIRDHWLALRNEKIDRVAAHANNAYLKTNRVKAGIDDYKGVVALVMDFKTDSLARARTQR
jgi:hypothetical protein